MTESEVGFIIGVFIITCVSATFYLLSLIAFNVTLSEEDAKTLSYDEPPENATLAKHTVILAMVNFISQLSFFINSAILVAIGLKQLF